MNTPLNDPVASGGLSPATNAAGCGAGGGAPSCKGAVGGRGPAPSTPPPAQKRPAAHGDAVFDEAARLARSIRDTRPPTVEITSDGSAHGTTVTYEGRQISTITSVDWHIDLGNVATATIATVLPALAASLPPEQVKVDDATARLLAAMGWQPPTGKE